MAYGAPRVGRFDNGSQDLTSQRRSYGVRHGSFVMPATGFDLLTQEGEKRIQIAKTSTLATLNMH